MCGARPIGDRYVITVVRPITSTGGARTDKWASEVLSRTTLAQDTANALVTSRNTSVALRHQRQQHHEVPVLHPPDVPHRLSVGRAVRACPPYLVGKTKCGNAWR